MQRIFWALPTWLRITLYLSWFAAKVAAVIALVSWALSPLAPYMMLLLVVAMVISQKD